MVNYSFTLANFEIFLLILVRIASFVFVAPFFGDSNVPRKVKIGLSFCVAVFMFSLVPHTSLEYESAIGYATIVVKEAIAGLLIGFAAYVCNSIVLFAGNIIDMDIGLSMVTEFNPEMKMQTTISGNLYYYLVMLLLITSDMHKYILRAVCDSFQVVPLGGAVFGYEHLLGSFTRYMGDLFIIGFRIFLPFFACIMILNCILGIMAKVAPQMNMFTVGMQLKILVGLVIMYLTVFMLPSVSDNIFKEIKTMVVSFIEGMY